MRHNDFHRWNLDPRFFYVWFWFHKHAFGMGCGPWLAVCDDFGNLVPVEDV